MIGERPWKAVGASIERATGRSINIERAVPLGGGCINQGFHLRAGGREFFVKFNKANRLAMFEAEAAGLAHIMATNTVRVPQPVCASSDSECAWLVLDYVALSAGGLDTASAARLGEQLASMHRAVATRFGWMRDNTIGSTPQINTQESDWVVFWRDHRLGFQLTLAAHDGDTGELQRQGERLLQRLPNFFSNYHPVPSLLHGDLWGGNAAATAAGEPVIFDPAVYYGDREADIAMTELFGGFPPAFYAAYRSAWPLDAGYAQRRDLYNLYHVLNHLNLFGGGYLRQAQSMIAKLLALAR